MKKLTLKQQRRAAIKIQNGSPTKIPMIEAMKQALKDD